MLDTDVFVCGGGPAGLAAAIAIRRHGLRVLVADCVRPPIDKACGEGLMPDSLAALRRLGIPLEGTPCGLFRGIQFVDEQTGASAAASFPNGPGHGVRRTLLHDLLRSRAAALGVDLLWETRVTSAKDGLVLLGKDHVRTRWIVAADGSNSAIRRTTGLCVGKRFSRRIGLRQHFRLAPWSAFVEIHWAALGQAYVTPIGPDQVGVVFILKSPQASLDAVLPSFPTLARRLAGAARVGNQRGSITLGQTYRRVVRGDTALIGDASGSVDAIVGEGLGLAFLQAEALGLALSRANGPDGLESYQRAHRSIQRVPVFLSRAMLLLNRYDPLRRHCISTFERNPALLARMLSIHVGHTPLRLTGAGGILHLGLHLLAP